MMIYKLELNENSIQIITFMLQNGIQNKLPAAPLNEITAAINRQVQEQARLAEKGAKNTKGTKNTDE